MEILIGCDNAAVELKNAVIQLLRQMDISLEDMGCGNSDDSINYPTIARLVCERVLSSNDRKRGILICGTGIGMCITANKFKGIRAAVCHDIFSAERSILSNKGNVLCLGARVIGPELAKRIVKEWLTLTFVDGPSTPKVQEIIAFEAELMK